MNRRAPTIIFCEHLRNLGNESIHTIKKSEQIAYIQFSAPTYSKNTEHLDLIELKASDQRPYKADVFLREYRNVMSEIGVENNSVLWWTSRLGTRNRFSTQLVAKLDHLLTTLNIVESQHYDKLIIVGLDESIKRVVKRFIQERGKKCTVLDPNKLWISFPQFLQSRFGPIFQILTKAIMIICRNIFSRMLLEKRFAREDRDSPVIIVKTFIHDNSFDESGMLVDQFFGCLPDYLKNQGKKLIILAHVNKNYRELTRKIAKIPVKHVFPYEYFLTVNEIIKGTLEVLLYRPRIRNVVFFGHDVTEIVKEEYQRSRIPLDQYMFFPVSIKLGNEFTLERFILTYEGNGWENACIAGLRKRRPSVHVLGYQHNVVVEAASGVFPTSREMSIKPMPNKILTAGEETREILLEHGEYTTGDIEASCALRYEWLGSVNERTEIRKNKEILLALEGVPQVLKLVDYCIRQFRTMAQYTLRIRAHSELPFSKINRDLNLDLSKMSNVIISEGYPLKFDLDQADICIYWGSAVALEALSIGIPLIRFDMQTILSFDPLIRCEAMKWNVNENDNLQSAIDSIYAVDKKSYLEQKVLAKSYLARFFYPVSDERLRKFLH